MEKQEKSIPCKINSFEPSGDATEIAAKWTRWINNFKLYIQANNVKKPERKKAYLLLLAGESVQSRFETEESLQNNENESDQIVLNALKTQAEEVKKRIDTLFAINVETEDSLAEESTTAADELRKARNELLVLQNKIEEKSKEHDQDEFQRALKILNNVYIGPQNSMQQRAVFHQMTQKSAETIGDFYNRLKVHAKFCDFNDSIDSELRQQILGGALNDDIRKQLYSRNDLSLKAFLDMAQKIEETETFSITAKRMLALKDSTICKVSEMPAGKRQRMDLFDDNQKTVVSQSYKQNNRASTSSFHANSQNCGNCGRSHPNWPCSAANIFCNACGKKGHYSRVCRSKSYNQAAISHVIPQWNQPRFAQQNFQRQQQYAMKPITLPYRQQSQQMFMLSQQKPRLTSSINFVKEKDEETSDIFGEKTPEEFICLIQNNPQAVLCMIGGIPINMVIDSGCLRNLITLDAWTKLRQQNVAILDHKKGTDVILKPYGSNTPLTVRGRFEAALKLNDITANHWFYIIEEGECCLLGKSSSEIHKVLSTGVKAAETKAPNAFSAINGISIDIPIDPTVTPVSVPTRRVPIHLQQAVKEKLLDLETRKIIEKVNSPSRWVSGMVPIIKKSGDIRICVDLRNVNKAIVREKHPIPTLDEMFARLSGAKFFSSLDAEEAFHQLTLHPDSRHLTTFATPWGMYRYRRLVFGICNAPEIFQKHMEMILNDCEGVIVYLDDILVYGSTEEQHDSNLEKVKEKLKRFNVKLNDKKSIYKQKEIQFVGHKLSESGIKASDLKLEAIKKFRVPSKKEELESFLGLVTWLGRFIPDLATITDPLRQLNKNRSKWIWENQHTLCFQEIKTKILSDMQLSYFDKNKQTFVVTDASPVGLGAVLYQIDKKNHKKFHFISCISKTLTSQETRYSQTEKEALAIVWAIERLNYFLLGSNFTLITDHKPLLFMFRTNSRPCARIERWILRLQQFSFAVIHKAGKNNIADSLSRLSAVDANPETFDEDGSHVYLIIEEEVDVAITLERISEECLLDEQFALLKQCIMTGNWHAGLKKWEMSAIEFEIIQDLIVKNGKVFIPKSLRRNLLDEAHRGHLGRNKMISLLKSKVWWPNMTADVEDKLQQCEPCKLVSISNPPEPIKLRKLPTSVFEHVAMDFKEVREVSKYLLVIVDYYSRYPIVKIQNSTSAEETIKNLRKVFAIFGNANCITSDNGPPFQSSEFSKFCLYEGIIHHHSIPLYAQGNGLAERAMRGLKKCIQISWQVDSSKWKEDLQDYLRAIRESNNETTGVSPFEMMFKRKPNSRIPMFEMNHQDDEEVRAYDTRQKEKLKLRTDKKRGAKLSNLNVGDKVYIATSRGTRKNITPNFDNEIYEIITKTDADCWVKSLTSNKMLRRHSSFLKKVSQQVLEQREKHQMDSSSVQHQQIDDVFDDEPMEDDYNQTPLMSGSLLRRSTRVRKAPLHLKDFIARINELTIKDFV